MNFLKKINGEWAHVKEQLFLPVMTSLDDDDVGGCGDDGDDDDDDELITL